MNFIFRLKEINIGRPEHFLLVSLALISLLGVIQTHSGPVRVAFLLLMVPGTIWALTRPSHIITLRRSVPTCLAIVLILFYTASLAWSHPTNSELLSDHLKQALETLVFIVGLFFALQSDNKLKSLFAKFLIVTLTLASLLSIYLFYGYGGHSINQRFDGSIYLLSGTSLSGAVLLGYLICAGILMEHTKTDARVSWLTIGFIATGILCFLTQSRGVLISYICLAFLWGGFYVGFRKIILLIVLAAVAIIVFVLTTHALEKAWLSHMATGLNGRILIWAHDIQGFLSKPYWGHGAAAIYQNSTTGQAITEQSGRVIHHPHGLAPSMLFYLGITGFLLCAAYIISLAMPLKRLQTAEDKLGLTALLCLLLATSMDVHTLIANVDVIWWVWWLPTLTIASLQQTQSEIQAKPWA